MDYLSIQAFRCHARGAQRFAAASTKDVVAEPSTTQLETSDGSHDVSHKASPAPVYVLHPSTPSEIGGRSLAGVSTAAPDLLGAERTTDITASRNCETL